MKVLPTQKTDAWALPVPVSDEVKKLLQIFIFALLYGASKGFMKVLKDFIKTFVAPQRSAKIKI